MRLSILLCVVGTGAAGFMLAFPVGFSAWMMVAIIAGGIVLVLVGLLGIVWALERKNASSPNAEEHYQGGALQ